MVYQAMDEPDVQSIMRQPFTMIASDSGVRPFGTGVPHPRGYGNNARVLGRYVRELKIITLEDAIRKMTSLPARTFKLRDRGELRPGAVADIVIFDAEKVSDPSRIVSAAADRSVDAGSIAGAQSPDLPAGILGRWRCRVPTGSAAR